MSLQPSNASPPFATPGFSTFDTPIGCCAVVWSARGLLCVQLPERTPHATVARIRKRFPASAESAPGPVVRRAIDAIVALLEGERRDLSFIPLDMDGLAPFHRRVYETARTIPAGATLTYGQLARRIGAPGAARAVGQALGKNPFAIVVPCHRVLAAGGKMGGFSAQGGVATKRRLLAIEASERFLALAH